MTRSLLPVVPTSAEAGVINTGPSEWSGHGVDAFSHCRQYWRLRYGGENSPYRTDSDQPALVKGTLFHVGLAHLYARRQARQLGNDPTAFLPPAAAVEALAASRAPVWRDYVPAILYALDAYRRYWEEEDRNLTILGVERTFQLAGLPQPHTRSEDLVYQAADGLVYFCDHKTTARLTSDAVEQYSLDGTFLDGELIGRQTFGAQWGGMILNMIELPKDTDGAVRVYRRPIGASPAALAQRAADLAEVYDDLQRAVADELLGNKDAYAWRKSTNGKACRRGNFLCAGFQTCRFGPTEIERQALGPLAPKWSSLLAPSAVVRETGATGPGTLFDADAV